MDRPPRKTKVVNYSEAKDFDDDDDFVCVKAPPSKRAREDVKQEHSKSSSMSSNQESNSQSATSQKSRRPLERELEAAITLSLLNNGDGIKDQSSTRNDVTIQVPVDENTDPTSAHLSNCSVDLTVLGLDEITSEKESPSRSRQRKAASRAAEEQKNKPTDEDEDYEPKLTPDSESDEDFSEPAESEDEEFTVKKVGKTKKKEKVTKNEKNKPPPSSKEKQASKPSKSKSQAAASTPVRSPPAAKLAPKKPASSSTVSSQTPVLPLSPAGGRIPKWNPPAQVGRSPSSSSPAVKSPGQGLRLGLSRLVRVKPLHPGVSSH
ncbi:RAD51-associated protein 1 isoform X2 [Anarrhichthys ocellatus]|uniref:RAD51-associated protein 1 isoform X2 n=1 Tax=Anarrhichthys ocellatus TaxID=433405 RepID=UPI0012ED9109|nr:RAD51-associated protein 1 isoform X2 [Anarrhichthys ocellatus]